MAPKKAHMYGCKRIFVSRNTRSETGTFSVAYWLWIFRILDARWNFRWKINYSTQGGETSPNWSWEMGDFTYETEKILLNIQKEKLTIKGCVDVRKSKRNFGHLYKYLWKFIWLTVQSEHIIE